MDTKTEHYIKYEMLATKIGIEALKTILPCTKEQVQNAIAQNDLYLNTIPLYKWDRAAGVRSPHIGPHDPQWPLNSMSFNRPWLPKVASGLSLAERVCVLKHVALYHL